MNACPWPCAAPLLPPPCSLRFMSSCRSRDVTSSHDNESDLDSKAVMRNANDSLKLPRSVITKSSSLTGAPTASSCSASLHLVDVRQLSSPSSILAVKKRRRRKSLFAKLFFSKWLSSRDHASCAPLADRTRGNYESSNARQIIASAFLDLRLNDDWSIAVAISSILISPLATCHLPLATSPAPPTPSAS